MMEIPCTLRCDSCKEAVSATAEASVTAETGRGIYTFIITDSVLPTGWRLTLFGRLRCPRCNGVK